MLPYYRTALVSQIDCKNMIELYLLIKIVPQKCLIYIKISNIYKYKLTCNQKVNRIL